LFSEPISITVNGVAQSMPRTSNVGTKSTYEKADGAFNLIIEQSTTKADRRRSFCRFEQKAVVTNPLDSTNDYDTMSLSLTIDRPSFGFTAAQQDQLLTGFRAWLVTATSDKLFGGES